MKTLRPRLIFFGTDAFSLPTLIQLLAEDWNVVAVVTKPDARTGRGRELTPPAVKRLATAKGIPVLQPTKLTDISKDIEEFQPTMGIVVAYGKIIPQKILDIFPKGLINVHASLLPHYRGASPIEHAILNDEEATGVTLMKLDAGLDTGPTYEATKIQLNGTENRLELYEKLAVAGAELLSAKLPAILDGTIVPIPQNKAKATHTGLIAKSDGIINWSKTAVRLEREVRAYLVWPGSRTTLANTDVTVTEAYAALHHDSAGKGLAAGVPFKTEDGQLAVNTNRGQLIINRLIPAGKREMSGKAFLQGRSL